MAGIEKLRSWARVTGHKQKAGLLPGGGGHRVGLSQRGAAREGERCAECQPISPSTEVLWPHVPRDSCHPVSCAVDPGGASLQGGAETGPSRALGAYSSLFQQALENIKAHSQLLSEAGVCSPQARPLRRPPLCIAGQPSNAPGPVPRREPRASTPRRHRSLEVAQEASTPPTHSAEPRTPPQPHSGGAGGTAPSTSWPGTL